MKGKKALILGLSIVVLLLGAALFPITANARIEDSKDVTKFQGSSQYLPDNAVFSCSSVTEIPEAECDALVALYTSTNGASWTDNTDWLVTDTPCSWYGVTCSGANVYALDLDDNLLSGPIPPQLEDLTSLGVIYLYDNQLTGSIPTELGNLANLKYLWMWNNQLNGSIPSQLGNLSN